jgi:hypothetical protein
VLDYQFGQNENQTNIDEAMKYFTPGADLRDSNGIYYYARDLAEGYLSKKYIMFIGTLK